MQSLKPGPFNGFFDEFDYHHPAFVPIITISAILVVVVIAMAWALWRGHPRKRRQTARGFDVVQQHGHPPAGDTF
jgi:hypothetical protein